MEWTGPGFPHPGEGKGEGKRKAGPQARARLEGGGRGHTPGAGPGKAWNVLVWGEEVSEGRKRAGKNEPCKQEARGQRLLEAGLA